MILKLVTTGAPVVVLLNEGLLNVTVEIGHTVIVVETCRLSHKSSPSCLLLSLCRASEQADRRRTRVDDFIPRRSGDNIPRTEHYASAVFRKFSISHRSYTGDPRRRPLTGRVLPRLPGPPRPTMKRASYNNRLHASPHATQDIIPIIGRAFRTHSIREYRPCVSLRLSAQWEQRVRGAEGHVLNDNYPGVFCSCRANPVASVVNRADFEAQPSNCQLGLPRHGGGGAPFPGRVTLVPVGQWFTGHTTRAIYVYFVVDSDRWW